MSSDNFIYTACFTDKTVVFEVFHPEIERISVQSDIIVSFINNKKTPLAVLSPKEDVNEFIKAEMNNIDKIYEYAPVIEKIDMTYDQFLLNML